MTKQYQAEKNIELSEELMNYLISKKIKARPNYSYVIFVEGNDEFNTMNNKLVEGLIKEGRKVIKAEKTKNGRKRWIFTTVN